MEVSVEEMKEIVVKLRRMEELIRETRQRLNAKIGAHLATATLENIEKAMEAEK